jgi:hypothetical protein
MRSSGKPFTDEDAPKKSVTDALVKALSMIGFAGDIFMGRYDDSKYVNDLRAEAKAEDEPAAVSPDLRAAYIAECRKKIMAFTSADDVKEWWNSAERKDQFAQFDLSEEEATDLKNGALDRRKVLARQATARAA